MPKPHHPTNPETPKVREMRLIGLIDQLETVIKTHDGYVSNAAISHLHQAREELTSELSLLQRGII